MTKAIPHTQWFLAPYCIGMKLRGLRNDKQLTLARLAAETGLSTALLSKLETDRMVPTLSTLATICRVYGIGLGYFFSEPTAHSLSITRGVPTQGRGRSADVPAHIPLNPAVPNPTLTVSMVELSAASSIAPANTAGSLAHLFYVLDGRMTLDMGGLREHLEAGDCAYFESDLPVAWGAAGKLPCRVLTVAAPKPNAPRA